MAASYVSTVAFQLAFDRGFSATDVCRRSAGGDPSTRAAASSIVNNCAIYLQSAYLYALLATRIVRKPLDRVSGIVVMGVFLGIFPPILDALLGSTDHGHYRYIEDGFRGFEWTLINPSHYSSGEAFTLWVLVVVLALYVLQVTRSLARTIVALALSYCAVAFIAMGPSSVTWTLYHRGWAAPFASTTRTAALSVTQLLLAQAAYLGARPTVASRLLRRSLHAAPFVALTFLGSAVAEYFSPSGLPLVERLRFTGVAAILILELCLVALVQNGAYDAKKDGRSDAAVTRDDAAFFTIVGVLLVLAVLLVLPGLGTPMAMFLCMSTLYSCDFYRAQRYFPANYKAEGVWGWSAFILGASARLSVAQTRATSGAVLVASLLVFGGWSLFNVFKDYKDIRADYKERNQTLYVLALRRGVGLRGLHRGLRNTMAIALAIPAILLGLCAVSWVGLAAVTVAWAACLWWILGGPPKKATVLRFLMATTGYVLSLAAVIEWQLRCR